MSTGYLVFYRRALPGSTCVLLLCLRSATRLRKHTLQKGVTEPRLTDMNCLPRWLLDTYAQLHLRGYVSVDNNIPFPTRWRDNYVTTNYTRANEAGYKVKARRTGSASMARGERNHQKNNIGHFLAALSYTGHSDADDQ